MAKDILILNSLAQRLRKRRSQNGSLRIDRDRLMFHLDENGTPFDCYNYVQNDSNRLIEEFMLLANFAVAQQIAVNLPEQALLRRHEEPIDRRIVSRGPFIKPLNHTNKINRSLSKNVQGALGTRWTSLRLVHFSAHLKRLRTRT